MCVGGMLLDLDVGCLYSLDICSFEFGLFSYIYIYMCGFACNFGAVLSSRLQGFLYITIYLMGNGFFFT